jgi:hypothetical protein
LIEQKKLVANYTYFEVRVYPVKLVIR